MRKFFLARFEKIKDFFFISDKHLQIQTKEFLVKIGQKGASFM